MSGQLGQDGQDGQSGQRGQRGQGGQGRLRGWLSRLRGIPARTERIDRVSLHLDSASHSLLATGGEATALLKSLHARLQRIESETAWARESQTAQLQPLLQRIEQQSELLAQLHSLQVSSSSLVSQAIHAAGVDLEATLAPSRDAALAELIAGLPAQTLRVEGLSVMIITWNHGAWLRRAIDSAQRSLELLPDHLAGKILIFDDASNDETATLLESLNEDSRILVIHSEVNLSLTRARNALLAVCPTTHAVILDADNRLSPAGVAQVYEVAATHRATITFGHVLASTESAAGIRTQWDAFAYAPSPWSLRNGYCFDSMAIIDVESVIQAGGYSTDPQLAGVADDLELLLRTLRQGKPVAFVPAVLGYYRKTMLRHSTTAADHKSVENRIARRYLYDDPDFEQFLLFGAHPATGILWASASAEARVGIPLTTASQPVEPSPSGPRILVVAPGGVGNIGDDAISACAVRRIRRAFPDCRIEMISDRALPQMSGQPVVWIGTVLQAWTGLRSKELSSGADLSQGQVTAEQISAAQATPPLLDLGSYQMAFFVGGGNLASAFAQNLLRPRVALSLCLSAAGVPVVVSGQGVGPCEEQELLLVQLMAGQAQAFGCRDAGSADLIDSEQSGNVELVGDDAMSAVSDASAVSDMSAVRDVAAVRDAAAEADSQRLDQVLRSALVPDGEFLVFHARQASYVGTTQLGDLAAAVDQLGVESNLSVLGLAVNNNPPAEGELLASIAQTANLVAPWRVIDAGQSVDLTVSLLSRASFVVTHSYHLALWALQAKTPAVLVVDSEYYRLKAEGLSALAGFPGSISISADATAPEIAARLDQVRSWLEQSELGAVSERVESWWSTQLSSVPQAQAVAT